MRARTRDGGDGSTSRGAPQRTGGGRGRNRRSRGRGSNRGAGEQATSEGGGPRADAGGGDTQGGGKGGGQGGGQGNAQGGSQTGPKGGGKGGRGGSQAGGKPGGKGGQDAGSGGPAGRRRPGQNNRRGRNRRQQQPEPVSFWGDATELPPPRTDVRITDDPDAVPRSLGTPPLPGQEAIAGHYFAAVYDRAVATAGALAAAGGLIDPDELFSDED